MAISPTAGTVNSSRPMILTAALIGFMYGYNNIVYLLFSVLRCELYKMPLNPGSISCETGVASEQDENLPGADRTTLGVDPQNGAVDPPAGVLKARVSQ